jgi:hypothetical protein
MDTRYLLLLSATVRISTFVYLYLYIIPFTLTHHLPYTPCYFTIERGSVHLVRVRERVSHKPFTTTHFVQKSVTPTNQLTVLNGRTDSYMLAVDW